MVDSSFRAARHEVSNNGIAQKTDTTIAIQHQFLTATKPVIPNPLIPDSIRSSRTCSPAPKLEFPRFNGDKIQDWLGQVEQYFEIANTAEKYKVMLVAINLGDFAATWNRSVLHSVDDWESYRILLLEQFDVSVAELHQLHETAGIMNYHERFALISARVSLPEDYLVTAFLTGLETATQRNVKMFRPWTVKECLVLGRLYESAHEVVSFSSLPFTKKTYEAADVVGVDIQRETQTQQLDVLVQTKDQQHEVSETPLFSVEAVEYATILATKTDVEAEPEQDVEKEAIVQTEEVIVDALRGENHTSVHQFHDIVVVQCALVLECERECEGRRELLEQDFHRKREAMERKMVLQMIGLELYEFSLCRISYFDIWHCWKFKALQERCLTLPDIVQANFNHLVLQKAESRDDSHHEVFLSKNVESLKHEDVHVKFLSLVIAAATTPPSPTFAHANHVTVGNGRDKQPRTSLHTYRVWDPGGVKTLRSRSFEEGRFDIVL